MTLDEQAMERAAADPEVRRLYWLAMRCWLSLAVALFLMPWRIQKAKRAAEITRRAMQRQHDRVRRAYLRERGFIL